MASTGLSARQLGEVLVELKQQLLGWTLRAVNLVPERDLLLVFEEPEPGSETARVRRLRLAADPDASRAHLQHARVQRPKGPPSPFAQLLESELGGAKLKQLSQPRGDRLLRLDFGSTPGGAPRALVAELTGRHANLLLLGGGDRLMAMLVAPKLKSGRPARLVRGEVYAPPPGSPPADPGPDLASALPAAPETPKEARQLSAPLSWLIENALGAQALESARDRSARNLRDRLKRKLSKARSLVNGLNERRRASQDCERVRQDGDLLASQLHTVKRGMEFIEIADSYSADGELRRIALAPQLTPAENLKKLYARYQKLERAKLNVQSELERAEERLAALEDLAERLQAGSEDPEALEAEALKAGWIDRPQAPPERRKESGPRLPYRSFKAQSGAEIRVGRNARDNDQLTFRHARGNDLWLHTADAPGSHVILRTERGRDPDPEDLLDAATLALHFSPLRGARKASIHLVPRKQVSKPRGAPAGLVQMSTGRTLALRLEEGRLARLLGREGRLDGAE